MTADEWAAEEYRHQRQRRGCRRKTAAAVVVLVILFVMSFRVSRIVVDRVMSR